MKQTRGHHTRSRWPALWGIGLALLLLTTFDARAQASISPSVISAGGASVEDPQVEFYATIGEPITTDSLSASDETTWIGFWQVLPVKPTASVDEELIGGARGATQLLGTHPSPFGDATTVELQLARPGVVELVAYDVLGREIERLVDGRREAGTLRITWRPSGIAPGHYFIRLAVDGVSYPALAIQHYR